MDVIRSERLLPIGIGLGCTLTRAVGKDQPLTFDDVRTPEGRIVDRLYREQEAMFGQAVAGQTQRAYA